MTSFCQFYCTCSPIVLHRLWNTKHFLHSRQNWWSQALKDLFLFVRFHRDPPPCQDFELLNIFLSCSWSFIFMFFERDTYSYKGYVKEKHFICKKIQLLCQWGIFQWLSHLTPKLLEKGFTNCKNKCLPVTIHEKFGKPKYTFTVKMELLMSNFWY